MNEVHRSPFHGLEEFLALKREFAKVKRERDFLRDAAAFFTSESK